MQDVPNSGPGGRGAMWKVEGSGRGARAVSSCGREMGALHGANARLSNEDGHRERAKTALTGEEANGHLRDSGDAEWERLTRGVVGHTAWEGSGSSNEGREQQGRRIAVDSPKAASSPAKGGVKFAVSGSEGSSSHTGASRQSPHRHVLVEAGSCGSGGPDLPGYKVGLGGVAMDVGVDDDGGECLRISVLPTSAPTSEMAFELVEVG